MKRILPAVFQNTTLLFIIAAATMMVFFSCGESSTEAPDRTEQTSSSGVAEIDELTRLISENPKDAELYHQRATIYYDRGVLRESIRDWTRALEIDSLNPEYYHRLADAFIDDNAPMLAIEIMEEVVLLHPKRIPSLLKLGEFYLIMEYYDEAIQSFNRVIIESPNHPEALFMKGVTFRDQGDSSRAIRFLQAALAADPDITDAYLMLGHLFMESGSELAGRYFDNAIRIEPDNPLVYHARAHYLHLTDQLDEALEEYSKMHVQFPSYADAFYNSGLIYMELNSLDEAFDMFNLAIQIRPTFSRAYFYRGRVYELRGELKRALDEYEQALNLSPRFQQAEEAMQRVNYEMGLDS